LQKIKRVTGLRKRKSLRNLRGKHITVVGLARSGVGTANLLAELGASVTVTDMKTADKLEDFTSKLSAGIKLALGTHPEDIFRSADMIVISPGVPLDINPLSLAKSKGIPIIGEVELAYQTAILGFDDPQVPPFVKGSEGGFLAVTGTNGKSTTTALLDCMMKKGGYNTVLGGNIGNALTGEIFGRMAERREQKTDFFVAEISSFQLEAIQNFRPKGAALLNITPDHLDRYHSMGEYAAAKARIFENQGEGDFLVLNRDDPETMNVKREKFNTNNTKQRIVYFSRREEVAGVYLKDGRLCCNLPDSTPVPHGFSLIGADEIGIKGVHNLENAMAASAMALLAGCPVEAVIDSLKRFPGLEHRLEPVRELNGVWYINDSKGTNAGAVLKSVESFSSPIILIAGGRDKAGDFSLLRDVVKKRVKSLVLIGEAREKIYKALGDLTKAVIATDLKEAIEISRNLAGRGDIILLSPACASFDMFEDFEDRGRQFKKIVMELK
jgi:UDP-N-acetylmuramoylalanine--D-glutamate ligase